MLQTAGKFATRIVLAFVALIVSHAALLACHHWHFYPDFWLAGMIVTTPSLFENELALWGLTLLGTIILWAILDYFFYRRKRTNGHPKPANGPAGGDIRKEMTLPDMLRHVGLGSVHHLSPTPEINIVHDFVSHLRQRLRSGEIRSWGQPHDKYPPDANLKPLEPIDAAHWRDAGIFAYEAFREPEKVKSMPDRAQGPGHADAPCYTALRFSSEDVRRIFAQNSWANRFPTLQVQTNTRASHIGDWEPMVALTVTNITNPKRDLRKCLVKIEQLKGVAQDTMPMPFVLRTEGQMRGNRSGRFGLSPTEPKTIPILIRSYVRRNEWFLMDENAKTHFIASHKLQMVIGLYADGSNAKAYLRVDPADNWRASATLTIVPDDFQLPQED